MVTDRSPGAGNISRRRGRVTLLVAAALALTLGGCASDPAPGSGPGSSAAPSESYGELPAFLPRDSGQTDGQLTGSAAHPALSVDGGAVKVQTSSGSVLAVVTGPEVPGEGLPNPPETTTCTWTVTLSQATAPVSISARDFTTLDHLGNVNQPEFVTGQDTPPVSLRPGRTATFELRDTMVVGEGIIRWAPGGDQTLASWDFTVEND